MLSFTAREIMAMDPLTLWSLPNGPIQIAFDDKIAAFRAEIVAINNSRP